MVLALEFYPGLFVDHVFRKACSWPSRLRQSQESESPRPAPGRIELAAAKSPGRTSTGSRRCPVWRSPALPAGACARPPPGSAEDLRPDPAPAAHENLARPSVRLHSPYSAPRVAPVHDGRHPPTRHKPEARYSLEPIHIS